MAGPPVVACACTPQSEADAPAISAESVESSQSAAAPVATGEPESTRTASLPEVDARRIALGTMRYQTTFTLDGEMRSVTTRRVVERTTVNGEAVVRVRQATESTESGEEIVDLAADSLRPLRRRFMQPTNSADIEYGDRLVRGEIKIAKREIPVRVELDAPAFGDGAALETAVLATPLARGFHAPLRSIEAGLLQRVRFWSLEVTGEETIEVPAGRYATFRIELEARDDIGGGMTLWVSRETPRLLVRLENRLPAELGGTVTTTSLVEGPEAGGSPSAGSSPTG